MKLQAKALAKIVHVKEVGEVKGGLDAETQSFGARVRVFELKVVKTDIEFEANTVVEHVAVVGFVVRKGIHTGGVEGVVHAVVAADRKA